MPSVISPIDPHGLRRNCVNLTQFLLCGFLGSTGANMSRVWGGTAFAKCSAAMKAPVGLLSGRTVCDSRWRGLAPTSATPTRSLRKCRRIAEVKSQWNTTFSRIENLWPRDGSCPLPLRSKSTFDKCFRIVKTQKISRGGAAHARGSPFTPNAVPAPVLQRR